MDRLLPTGLPRRRFIAGDIVFEQDTPGDCAYILVQGQVEISRRHGRARKVLGLVGPGGIFGEMALVDGAPRMARALAVPATTCLVVDGHWFRAKLKEADPTIRALLRIFVHNIRSLTEQTMSGDEA